MRRLESIHEFLARCPALLAGAAAACLSLLVLVLAGQPLITDDTWFHLALGRDFIQHGPWLDSDPHLSTAVGPPSASAWLADIALYQSLDLFGFTGLRALHAALAMAILLVCWRTLKHASGSNVLASAGLSVFIALSTYRIAQLRPHLFTLLATLLLYRLLFAHRGRPSNLQIVLSVVLCVIWANFHASFLLGPILIGSACLTLLAVALLENPIGRKASRERASGLGFALLLILPATVLNPGFVDAHLSYFLSGSDTLALTAVVDEWRPVDLFAFPLANLPPSPLAWIACWAILAGVGLCAASMLRRSRRAERRDETDPADLGLALAGVAAMLIATRFLWLGIFGLIVIARMLGSSARRSAISKRRLEWSIALLSLVVVPAFWVHGDWTMLSRNIRGPGVDYREAYPAAKYSGHAAWLLSDAGLTGNVYNDYSLGGFLSFWLAPELKMSSSGTMNMQREAMDAHFAIAARRGLDPAETFLELLDRQEIDIFLGAGLPLLPPPNRPTAYTTRHLEGSPGWIPVFRNLRSALYLRANPRNAENLERIASFYRREGVPFDPEIGFDVERVIVESKSWAISHGVIPQGFDRLMEAARRSRHSARHSRDLDRLSLVYLALGLYQRSLFIDEFELGRDPDEDFTARRMLWCLLRLGRLEDAQRLAEAVEARGTEDPLLSMLIESTMEARRLEGEARTAMISRLPALLPFETGYVMAGFVRPLARTALP